MGLQCKLWALRLAWWLGALSASWARRTSWPDLRELCAFDLWDGLYQRGHNTGATVHLLCASCSVLSAVPPLEVGSVMTRVADEKTKLQRGKLLTQGSWEVAERGVAAFQLRHVGGKWLFRREFME